MTSDERQPLLQRDPPLDGPTLPENPAQAKGSSGHPLGPSEITRATRARILAGIWMASFFTSANTTMAATLMSSISSEFNRSHLASWIGTSFSLATCTFTPLYGRLCDSLGRKNANQLAVMFTGVGILASGLSNDLEMLIVARFLTGMGRGGIFTTASVIASDMFTLRERSMVQGVSAIFNTSGMALGGLLGGWISDRYGWRWAFLIQVPFFALSFFFTATNLNYVVPGGRRSVKAILKRIDYGGCFATFITVGALLCFLSFKYNQDYPWDSAPVVASLAILGVAAVTFLIIELKLAYEPMLAPSLLRQHVPVIVGCSYLLVSMCHFAIMFFYPMWFETVQLRSAGVAGAHLFPHFVSMSFGSLFAGWYISRTGRYKTLTDICGLFALAAALLVSRLREDSTEFSQWSCIIPMGFGIAVVWQTTLICLLAAVDSSAVAVSTGFTRLFRGLGQVIGLAFSSAFFQSTLDKELRARITGENADEYIRRIRHSTKLVARLEPQYQRHARDSYAFALRHVFLYAAACSLVGFALRLWLPELSLDRSVETPVPSGSTASSGSNERQMDGRREIAHLQPTPRVGHPSTSESGVGFDIEEHGVPASPAAARKPGLTSSVYS